MTIWISLSLALIGLTVILKPLRKLLERCAFEAARQRELVDEYYLNATRFMRMTDPKRHSEAREMVVWVGNRMLQGTYLIKSLIMTRMRRNEAEIDKAKAQAHPLAGVPEEAFHAFGRAVGAALLVSTYQSFFMGRQLRSMLQLVMQPENKEVKEAEQIVFRYRKAVKLPHHNWFGRAA